MKTTLFSYSLPAELIAQHPAERRGTEKMMVLHRDTGVLEHRHIADIVDYITWNCIVGSGRKCREGMTAVFGPNAELKATLVRPLQGIGMWRVDFAASRPLMELLDEFGRTPVPPYIKRDGNREEELADRERYQTIYAKHVGSVAAPTAGLHFTPEIFAALDAKGVKRVAVTLHVGPGTFRPVKAENIEDHFMDFEAFTVPPETAEAINECKKRGGRVFCCGSTVVRTLETVAAREGAEESASAMLTNFHLPQSTLIMMVSALAGRERILCSYAMAVRAGYKFFSYGDCMLIV